jgi:hypothetical protein
MQCQYPHTAMLAPIWGSPCSYILLDSIAVKKSKISIEGERRRRILYVVREKGMSTRSVIRSWKEIALTWKHSGAEFQGSVWILHRSNIIIVTQSANTSNLKFPIGKYLVIKQDVWDIFTQFATVFWLKDIHISETDVHYKTMSLTAWELSTSDRMDGKNRGIGQVED